MSHDLTSCLALFFWSHLFTCTCDAYVQYNITFFVLVRYQIFSWHHCYICTHTLAQFLYFISITFHLKLLCPADAPSTAAFEGMLSTPPAPAKMFPVSSTNDTGTSTCVNIYCVPRSYLTLCLQLPRQQAKERKLKSPRRQRLPRILLLSGLRECQVPLAASRQQL